MTSHYLAALAVVTGLFCGPGACQRSDSGGSGVAPPRQALFGSWSGTAYTNDAAGNREPTGSVSLEFQFKDDGTCRVGKARTWFQGTYHFLDDRRFEMKAGRLFEGTYEVVEQSPNRVVYERKLEKGRTQRTELTRL